MCLEHQKKAFILSHHLGLRNDRTLILEFALLNRGVPSPRKLANARALEKCLRIRVGFTGSSSSITNNKNTTTTTTTTTTTRLVSS